MPLKLNTIGAEGSKTRARKRLGRGIGSTKGKTSGKGHKGQKARSGGKVSAAFEGGQMPLVRRLPKTGFKSRVGQTTAEVRLHELNKVDGDIVNIKTLQQSGIINKKMERARIIASGDVTKAVTIASGIKVTKGARAAIEKAGGKVED